MRRRWILVATAVAALSVLGTFGAIAFGGVSKAGHANRVSHSTKTVTVFCIYVDHTGRGDSNGDLSALKKYGHKICIAGKKGARGGRGATGAAGTQGPKGDTGTQGPKGDTGAQGPKGATGAAGAPGSSGMVTWNATVATGGIDDPNTVTLATVGPFTLIGECFGGEGTSAETDLTTSQDGSFLQWDDEQWDGNFNNDGPYFVSQDANGDPGGPDWIGPTADDSPNEFAAQSADGSTTISGSPNEGVYVQGPDGPACSFSGYLVKDVAAG